MRLPLIQSAADERQAAVQDDARLFAIFLDEYHVTSGANTDRVRDALLRFVDRDLTPRDLVAVMKPLDSLFTIRLTRDRGAVRRAIETLRRPQRTIRAAQRLRARLYCRHAGANRGDPQPGGVVGRQRPGRTPRQPRRSTQDARRRHRGDRRIRPPPRSGVPADAGHDHPLGEPVERRRLSVRPERRRRRPGGGGVAAAGRGHRRRGDSRRCGVGTAACRRRLERVLPAVVPVRAPRRREIPRAAAARHASRRARARAKGLLGSLA